MDGMRLRFTLLMTLPACAEPAIEKYGQRQHQRGDQITTQHVARLVVTLHDSADANQGDEIDADDQDRQEPFPALRLRPADEQNQEDEKPEEHRDMFDMARRKAVRAQPADRRHMNIVGPWASDEAID